MKATGLIQSIIASTFLFLGIHFVSAQENPPGQFDGHCDIGMPKISGSASYNPTNRTYTLTGSGINMWGTNDQFQFLWKEMKGDFIVRARVEFVGKGVEEHRKVGWMARSGFAPNATYVDAVEHGNGLTSLQYRQFTGTNTLQIVLPITNADVIQFERHGTNYIFSAAHSGKKFVSANYSDISLPDDLFVGLFICSHNPKVKEEVIFHDVKIIQPGHRAMKKSKANGKGAYATGHYRNLFAEDGHSPPEIQNKINSAFEQLFHGNPTNQAVFYYSGSNSNGPLAFITDIKHHDVRTEGLSYGMIIAVEMNKQEEFDALWNWSKTYLYHNSPKDPSYGFFSWEAKTNGEVMSEFVAPDGESYYVMALYFAANRWGSGQGIYNYKAEADQLLTNMRHRAIIKGQIFSSWRGTNHVATVSAGPLFSAKYKMVLFSPSTERPPFTDPSYHLPAFYELWARWGPKADRQFWLDAAKTSRDFFWKTANPVTGLAPDYANFDGTPVTNSWNKSAAHFGFDAFRVAGNWSVDWSWWGKDVRERELSDRLQAFFESKGMDTYGCQFTLDGKQLDDRHAQGLVAVNADASLAATNPRAKKFVEALWNTPTPDGIERYYEGLLYMMALLHCSGEFQIWSPQ